MDNFIGKHLLAETDGDSRSRQPMEPEPFTEGIDERFADVTEARDHIGRGLLDPIEERCIEVQGVSQHYQVSLHLLALLEPPGDRLRRGQALYDSQAVQEVVLGHLIRVSQPDTARTVPINSQKLVVVHVRIR